MTNGLMIAAGFAVLLSYWFLHLGRKLNVPSVVLLLFAGLIARLVTQFYHVTIEIHPDWLSILGAIGLVLIILEATLDLDLTNDEPHLLTRSCGAAALGFLITLAPIAGVMKVWLGLGWYDAILMAMPFSIIGSSIAIPGAERLLSSARVFVVFESSWSDIIGVMIFNALFSATNPYNTTVMLLTGAVAAVVIGTIAGLLVSWLIGHLEGDVKFLPLLFALILVYGTASALNFSPLLVVLILGLILNNRDLLAGSTVLKRLYHPDYDAELVRFKHVTSETTFVVRSFFFLLLGYTTDIGALSDEKAWATAAVFIVIIVAFRWLVLIAVNARPIRPLLWAMPRGLITSTLFLQVSQRGLAHALPPGALVLVILSSCLVMAIGFKIDGQRKTR